jgi:hypothetical protein
VTDAEVLQEIMHRYVAIDRRDAIQPAFDALFGVVDEVLSVDRGARPGLAHRRVGLGRLGVQCPYVWRRRFVSAHFPNIGI